MGWGWGRMAERIQVLATEPDYLKSIPRTQGVREPNPTMGPLRRTSLTPNKRM